MKYIRTKDNRIVAIPNKSKIILYDDEKVAIDITKKGHACVYGLVIKQADTIEELCDAFWWENEMYNEPIFIPNYLLALDRFDSWKKSDKELNMNSFDRITIYGSIYIKGKGWVHVAKMNDKGELELL